MTSKLFQILLPMLLLGVLTACHDPFGTFPFLPNSQPTAHLNVTNRATIAPDGYELVDLRADATRLFVTDSMDQLHILDRSSLAVVRTMIVGGGQLSLDAARHRLYVAPGDRYALDNATPVITVIDTQTLDMIGALPGRYVGIDPVHNRIYTGVPLTLEIEQAISSQSVQNGVRLFDGETLAELAVGAQPGIPVYNPARDELLIVAYTVYTANAQTLAIERDLLPALTNQELRWCTGCEQAAAATLFPPQEGDADLLLLEINTEGGGKGSGLESAMRWLDARTLEPVVHTSALQQMCGTQKLLRPPMNGHVYRSLTYSRYQEIHNVLVEDLNGIKVRQIDGLQLLYTDARTGTGISRLSGTQNLLLDLAVGAPVGLLPAFCLLGAVNGGSTLYGAAGGDLLQVESIQGAMPDMTASANSAHVNLADESVNMNTTLTPNPAMPQEQVGLDAAGALYHSANGGQTWRRVAGGLPQWAPSDVAVVTLQPSPHVAEDKTLYWAGVINDQIGLGVWRSVDGGAFWQPVWQGLNHLRVTRLDISPDFAMDHTLWATADFALISASLASQENGAASLDAAPESPIQTGRSLWRSTNRGDTWSLVATAETDASLPDFKSLE